MGYLPGFIPWIVAGVVSSFDWRWGAIGGLVTGLLLLLQDRRRGSNSTRWSWRSAPSRTSW
jgi:hypothetical protein